MFLLACTSADIIFHKILELHSTLSEKNIFVTNFPFLTDSLKPPTPTSLTAKICWAWQKFLSMQTFPYENNCQWVLQKARINIVAGAIYAQLFFPYTYTLLVCSSCDCCFPQQIRPQTTIQLYILRDYSNERIGFNMINKQHKLLPIIYTMLV